MGKTLCIIHAPQDERAAATLKKHMTMSIRNGLYLLVDDVVDAQVVVVIISNDMVVDDRAFAMSEQAKRKRAAGDCHLVPILVEPMAEFPDHLAMLASLPRDGKPARTDEQWASIAAEMRQIGMRPC